LIREIEEFISTPFFNTPWGVKRGLGVEIEI
jgi:hypothetical protein